MSCGALCLPNSTSTARCSCPSYGGKVLKSNNQCVGMYITEAVIVMHDCRPHYIIYDNYADSNYTSSQFLIKQLLKLLLLPLSHLSSSSSSSSFVFFLPLLRFCCSSDTTFCTKISGFLTWCFGSPSLCSLLRFFSTFCFVVPAFLLLHDIADDSINHIGLRIGLTSQTISVCVCVYVGF